MRPIEQVLEDAKGWIKCRVHIESERRLLGEMVKAVEILQATVKRMHDEAILNTLRLRQAKERTKDLEGVLEAGKKEKKYGPSLVQEIDFKLMQELVETKKLVEDLKKETSAWESELTTYQRQCRELEGVVMKWLASVNWEYDITKVKKETRRVLEGVECSGKN